MLGSFLGDSFPCGFSVGVFSDPDYLITRIELFAFLFIEMGLLVRGEAVFGVSLR